MADDSRIPLPAALDTPDERRAAGRDAARLLRLLAPHAGVLAPMLRTVARVCDRLARTL